MSENWWTVRDGMVPGEEGGEGGKEGGRDGERGSEGQIGG